VLHFALYSSAAGAMPNAACQLFDIAVLMSVSHRLFIIRSQQDIGFEIYTLNNLCSLFFKF
jgi:hypothetical protein